MKVHASCVKMCTQSLSCCVFFTCINCVEVKVHSSWWHPDLCQPQSVSGLVACLVFARTRRSQVPTLGFCPSLPHVCVHVVSHCRKRTYVLETFEVSSSLPALHSRVSKNCLLNWLLLCGLGAVGVTDVASELKGLLLPFSVFRGRGVGSISLALASLPSITLLTDLYLCLLFMPLTLSIPCLFMSPFFVSV